IGGTDIAVVLPAIAPTINGLTTLGGTYTFTGDLILGGDSTGAATNHLNEVVINTATAMPQGAGQDFLYNRNFSQIAFTAGGASGAGTYTATFNNNFNLNNSGSGT